MSYYPKSQIKTNLYSTIDDYLTTSTNQTRDFLNSPLEQISNLIYTGYYYETSSGQKFTGKFPGDGDNLNLFPIDKQNLLMDFYPDEEEAKKFIDLNTNFEEVGYFQLRGNTKYKRLIPSFYTPMLTQQEKDQGYLTRYFCKKGNEIKYIEISREDFNKLQSKSNDIAWDLYDPFSIKWLIKGNKEEVFKSNKGAVAFEERKNRRLGLSQYLRNNFTKYYLES